VGDSAISQFNRFDEILKWHVKEIAC